MKLLQVSLLVWIVITAGCASPTSVPTIEPVTTNSPVPTVAPVVGNPMRPEMLFEINNEPDLLKDPMGLP